MDNPKIDKAVGKVERNEQIARLVGDRRDHSAFTYNSQRIKFPSYYNLYRGTVNTKGAPFKNNVFIPMVSSTVQSDVARKTQTSFGMYPYITFTGNSPEDAIIARKREALINSQLKDLGIFKKMYDLFLTTDLYGTGVIQYGWRHEEEDILMTEYEFLPLSGTLEPVMNKRRITTFDGPDFKVLDPLDCYPQPGILDVEDMEWFITQDWMDFEKVKRLAVIKEDGRSLFDANEVRRLEEDGAWAEQSMDDYKDFRSWGRTVSEFDARNREKYARPVKLYTQFGRVPHEMAPDGITNRIITVANDRYVLRNEAGGEGRHLIHRADDKLILLLKAAHALQQLPMQMHRPRDIVTGQFLPLLDLPHRFGFNPVAMVFKQRPEGVPIVPCSQSQKYFIGPGQIGHDIFHDTAEIDECLALAIENFANSSIKGQTAEIWAPGYPHVSKIAIQRLSKDRRVRWITSRIAPIGAGHCAQ